MKKTLLTWLVATVFLVAGLGWFFAFRSSYVCKRTLATMVTTEVFGVTCYRKIIQTPTSAWVESVLPDVTNEWAFNHGNGGFTTCALGVVPAETAFIKVLYEHRSDPMSRELLQSFDSDDAETVKRARVEIITRFDPAHTTIKSFDEWELP